MRETIDSFLSMKFSLIHISNPEYEINTKMERVIKEM
jgi:hypothetical protein